MFTILGKAERPSLLYLNRTHGEEIEVELAPVSPEAIWQAGPQGVYAVMEAALGMFADRYENDPRVLWTSFWPF